MQRHKNSSARLNFRTCYFWLCHCSFCSKLKATNFPDNPMQVWNAQGRERMKRKRQTWLDNDFATVWFLFTSGLFLSKLTRLTLLSWHKMWQPASLTDITCWIKGTHKDWNKNCSILKLCRACCMKLQELAKLKTAFFHPTQWRPRLFTPKAKLHSTSFNRAEWRDSCCKSTFPSHACVLEKDALRFFGLVQPKWPVRTLWSCRIPCELSFFQHVLHWWKISLECTTYFCLHMQHFYAQKCGSRCWRQFCQQNASGGLATSLQHNITTFGLAVVSLNMFKLARIPKFSFLRNLGAVFASKTQP